MELTPHCRRHGGESTTPAGRGQQGFTLIEVLVSIAILAIIFGSVAAAVQAGVRALGAGGAGSRLTGSHDLIAFEQQLGADIARADCLATPGQSTPSSGGSCSVSSFPAKCGSSFLLCVAWYSPSTVLTTPTCHTITYWQQSAGAPIMRSDLSPPPSSQQVTTGGFAVTVSWTPHGASGGAYTWVSEVSVAVDQTGTPGAPAVNPAKTTFVVVPLSTDPVSTSLLTRDESC